MPQEEKLYKNVMEVFVETEIKSQLTHNKMINAILSEFNLLEVATFALNRLPSLYASSKEGFERQKRKLRQDRNLRAKVALAVSQGFAAVERDPLRRSTPIITEGQPSQQDIIQRAKQTLTQLSDALPEKELNWLISFMEQFLGRVGNKQITEEEIVKLFFLLYYYWQENNE